MRLQYDTSLSPNVTPIALKFRRWLGGEKAIYKYTHKLAVDGASRLAEILGTEVMDKTGELTVSMVSRSSVRARLALHVDRPCIPAVVASSPTTSG